MEYAKWATTAKHAQIAKKVTKRKPQYSTQWEEGTPYTSHDNPHAQVGAKDVEEEVGDEKVTRKAVEVEQVEPDGEGNLALYVKQ
jgi:hypothetical protein